MCKLQYKVFDAVEEETKIIQLLDWLGAPRQADFTKARFLGRLIGVILFVFFVGLIVTTLFQFGLAVTGLDGFDSPAEKHAAIRNTGLIVAAIIGVPFIIWRAAVAQKQVDVAEQSHITDRISKAVEQLGATRTVKKQRVNSAGKRVFENGDDGKPDLKKPIYEDTTEPNLEVRLGGIYALERISKDSEADHIQIMEILCAYVRENSSEPRIDMDETKKAQEAVAKRHHREVTQLEQHQLHGIVFYLEPRVDIQTILTVLGRRRPSRIKIEANHSGPNLRYRLDLRNCQLQRAYFAQGEFSHTQFDNSDLTQAILYSAKLQHARFNKTILHAAKLGGTDLSFAVLDGAQLDHAKVKNANFNLCAVKAASFFRTIDLTFEQVNTMVGDSSTYFGWGSYELNGEFWHEGQLSWDEFLIFWRAAKVKAGLP